MVLCPICVPTALNLYAKRYRFLPIPERGNPTSALAYSLLSRQVSLGLAIAALVRTGTLSCWLPTVTFNVPTTAFAGMASDNVRLLNDCEIGIPPKPMACTDCPAVREAGCVQAAFSVPTCAPACKRFTG